MPYRWEPNAGASGRYRDERGRFVASSTVRRELDRDRTTATRRVRWPGAARAGGGSWRISGDRGMRRVVKNTHLNAIALERGGYANLTHSDYGRAGQIIREQYGYLKGFAADIASGKQKLDGTLAARARLYSQAGRNSYYRSKAANMSDRVTHQRSIRGKWHSCWQCIELNGKVFGSRRPILPVARPSRV